MTWHPLATNPLPEPRDGQTLLIQHKRYPHPDTFICKPERGPQWLGGGGLGDTVEMRSHFIELDPSAQWFLVPAPGEPSEADELRKRVAELESDLLRIAEALGEYQDVSMGPRYPEPTDELVEAIGSLTESRVCAELSATKAWEAVRKLKVEIRKCVADLDEWAKPVTTGMGSGLHAEKWPTLSPSARKLLQEIVGRLKR